MSLGAVQGTAIPLNKWKTRLLFALSCGFVALGYWLLGRADAYVGWDHWKALFAAWSSLVFFGFGALVLAFKSFDHRPGVIINEKGIYRLGVFNYHLPILWARIRHCSETKVRSTRLLLIHVDNTEEVLAGTPPITRWFKRLTLAHGGALYRLSSAVLDCDFDELRGLVEGGIANFGHHD
jgi:hypothetical protein